jgi:hypothetical protein
MEFNKMTEYIKRIVSFLTGITLVSLICGFIIVNIYLSGFGFYDFSFFQTRYIAAGIPFLIIIGLLFLTFSFILKKSFLLLIIFLLTFLSLIFQIYPKLIYPNIQFAYGGGKPICVAILFNEQGDNIIPVKEKLPGETQYLITKLLYQTDDYLLLKTDRGVFLVYQDKIKSVYYPDNMCNFNESGKNLFFLN